MKDNIACYAIYISSERCSVILLLLIERGGQQQLHRISSSGECLKSDKYKYVVYGGGLAGWAGRNRKCQARPSAVAVSLKSSNFCALKYKNSAEIKNSSVIK